MSRRATAPRTEATSDTCEVDVVDLRKVAGVRRAMRPAAEVQLLAETFRVLGDATRVRILFCLTREELCVCDLATLVGASQSAVSHSLRSLRQMNLVRYRKEGRIAYYSLDDQHIAHLLEEGFGHARELV